VSAAEISHHVSTSIMASISISRGISVYGGGC
jgi:hypothetical protein